MVKDRQDKHRHHRIEEEVRKTLEAFDSMETLEAGPYFYQRVQAQLKSSQAKKLRWLPGSIGVTAFRSALLVLLVLVNLITAIYFLTQSPPAVTAEKPLRQYLSSLTQHQSQESSGSLDTYVTQKIMESKD